MGPCSLPSKILSNPAESSSAEAKIHFREEAQLLRTQNKNEWNHDLSKTLSCLTIPKIHRKSHTCVEFQDPCFPCCFWCPCFLVGCRLLFYQLIFVTLFPSLRHPGVPEFHSFVDSRDSFGTNVLGVINAMLFILPKTQILWVFHPKNVQRNDLVTLFAPLHCCAWGVCRTKFPETVTQRPLRWKHAKPNCDFNCSGLFLKSKTRFHDWWFLVRGHLKKCKTRTFEFCLLPFMSYLDMKPSWVFWTSCQPFLAQQGQCAANDDTSSWWWY